MMENQKLQELIADNEEREKELQKARLKKKTIILDPEAFDRNDTQENLTGPQNDQFVDFEDEIDIIIEEKKDHVENQLLELEEVISGQQIEQVKTNYELRNKLAKFNQATISSIWVKYVLSSKQTVAVSEYDVAQLPTHYYEDDYNSTKGYVTTFRIGRLTKFSEIFEASCEFWKLNNHKYILTDEYFNDLVLYNETICNFFKHYEPLNPDNLAVIYITTKSNQTQLEDKEMDDQKAKNGNQNM